MLNYEIQGELFGLLIRSREQDAMEVEDFDRIVRTLRDYEKKALGETPKQKHWIAANRSEE